MWGGSAARPSRARPSAAGDTRHRRRLLWRLAVPVVCLGAGVGLATSAHTSAGTELRAPGTANLAGTVRDAEARVGAQDAAVRSLQRQVAAAQARVHAAEGDSAALAQRRAAALAEAAGMRAVRGAGLTVVLDDASGDAQASGVDVNELVVHQSDLQAVVNSMWAGGATAVSIAGQRVIATSAVRCVGNTLLLNGAVYSPPYRVVAIGPAAKMQHELSVSRGVKLFRQAAEYFGLGYTTSTDSALAVPAYDANLTLLYARPAK